MPWGVPARGDSRLPKPAALFRSRTLAEVSCRRGTELFRKCKTTHTSAANSDTAGPTSEVATAIPDNGGQQKTSAFSISGRGLSRQHCTTQVVKTVQHGETSRRVSHTSVLLKFYVQPQDDDVQDQALSICCSSAFSPLPRDMIIKTCNSAY